MTGRGSAGKKEAYIFPGTKTVGNHSPLDTGALVIQHEELKKAGARTGFRKLLVQGI